MAGLVLLIVALPPAAVGTAVQRLADHRWDEVEGETWTRLSALQNTRMHRPILRGEPEPGNAWKDYEKARLLKYGEDIPVLENFANRKGELSLEEVQACLEPHLPLLKSIQAGTRRADLIRLTPWNDPLPPFYPSWVITFGVCRARFLVEQGDAAEAVTLLLDLMQFLGDLGRLGRGSSRWSALYFQDRLQTELNSMMAAGLLGRDELRQIFGEMAILEKSMPKYGTILREEAMFTALDVLKAKTVEEFVGAHFARDSKIPTWQFAFSQKLLLSRYAELQYRMAEQVARGDESPWSDARRRTTEACDELAAARHPFFDWKGNPGGRIDLVPQHRAHLEYLAHFRLIRAAAGYLAEGKVPELDDPYGDKLRWAKAGAGVRLWSVGWDGVDQGGRGGWTGRNNPDIVLDVRR
jgi:hypothetical protein